MPKRYLYISAGTSTRGLWPGFNEQRGLGQLLTSSSKSILSELSDGLSSTAGSQLVERNLPVSVTEPLGNETLIFVAFGGRDWVTRMLNAAPLKVGLTIPVSFDLAKAHLFSIEDGRTIAVTEG
jgi:multiple sugar transport system ATP-binding protein